MIEVSASPLRVQKFDTTEVICTISRDFTPSSAMSVPPDSCLECSTKTAQAPTDKYYLNCYNTMHLNSTPMLPAFQRVFIVSMWTLLTVVPEESHAANMILRGAVTQHCGGGVNTRLTGW